MIIDTNINHKGLQRTANEYAEKRRIYKDLINKNNNVDILNSTLRLSLNYTSEEAHSPLDVHSFILGALLLSSLNKLIW